MLLLTKPNSKLIIDKPSGSSYTTEPPFFQGTTLFSPQNKPKLKKIRPLLFFDLKFQYKSGPIFAICACFA